MTCIILYFFLNLQYQLLFSYTVTVIKYFFWIFE